MNTVGRIGRCIGRGVSSVSGTFHPFGGSVDIIVVEQPDGSFKSSPWYVRFGKFQGVLKAREKVVHITVNGVEASFHMYLDSRGRAFFIKEIEDIEDGDSLSSSSASSSGEDTDGQTSSKLPTKPKSCGEDVLVRDNSRGPGILGMVFGRKSMKNDSSIISADSLERAEMAADLLEMKWSTNLTPKRYSRDYAVSVSAQDISKGVKEEELQINDKKSDMSSLAHDNVLDNLDFCEPSREKSVKKTGKHVLFSASEKTTRVSDVVQGVEDYSSEESLRISGDGGELGLVNADHDARGGAFISEEKHDSFTANRLPEEETETAAVQSFFYCETEENSTVVLDVSTEEFTQNLRASRDLEARMHAQTVLSLNDLMSVENSQPEEKLLFEKDPSNGFKVITNNTFPNSITHFLVSESGSLNSSAAEADFGCILPVSCSGTSTYKDQDQKTSITDKATSKTGASSEVLGDPNESRGSLIRSLTISSSESLEEEQLLFGDIDDCCDNRYTESTSSDYKENEDYRVPNYESSPTLDNSIQSDPPIVADGRKLKTVSSNVDIPAIVQDNGVMRMGRSLPNMWSHDNDLPSNPDDLNKSMT